MPASLSVIPAKAGIYQITVIPAVVGGYPSSGLDARLREHDEEIRELLSHFPPPLAGIYKIFFLLIINPDFSRIDRIDPPMQAQISSA